MVAFLWQVALLFVNKLSQFVYLCSYLGWHVACIRFWTTMDGLIARNMHTYVLEYHMFTRVLSKCFLTSSTTSHLPAMHVSADCLCLWESTGWAPRPRLHLPLTQAMGQVCFGPEQDPSFYFLHTGWSEKVLHFDEDQITFLFQVRLSVSKNLLPNLGLWGSPPEFRLCTLYFVSLGLVYLEFF